MLTLSDSDGVALNEDGLTREHLSWLADARQSGARMKDFADEFGFDYLSGEAPWNIACDIAVPCATQNELNDGHAEALIDNGASWVAEGANMPLTADAMHRLRESSVVVCPAKAANAGGVAVSGLEMSQNAQHEFWSEKVVRERLESIMTRIHESCLTHLDRDAGVDYVSAANRAGFLRVARAMVDQGAY